VALDVELCRRGRSLWRSCGSMTAQVNTWPRWSTGGPLPRLHVVRRALTNRTTTAGSGRCAESEAAAIVTKVTVGQYVKLQVCRPGRAGRGPRPAGKSADDLRARAADVLEYAVNWLVTSVSEAVETIVEAGGKVILKPTQIPVGRLAVVNDPFGNALVLLDLSAGRYVTDVDGRVLGVQPRAADQP
jgi:hypothetical protein